MSLSANISQNSSPLKTIRLAVEADWDEIWNIFHPIVQGGDLYTYLPDTNEEEARKVWFFPPGNFTYVAVSHEDKVVGTYVLRPCGQGLCSHVCSCSFMVHPQYQNQGIGYVMGKHSLLMAAEKGYEAVLLSWVKSTSLNAIHLYKKLGFVELGRIPLAFRHQKLGRLVDVVIMHRFISKVEEDNTESQLT